MRVRQATNQDARAWEEFLVRFPGIPSLATPAWMRTLAETYQLPTVCFLAEAPDGRVQGICPMYLVRDPAGRVRCYSFRYGLVAESDRVAHALVDAVAAYAIAHGATTSLLALGTPHAFPDHVVHTKSTMRIVVPPTVDAAWASLRNKTRNMVRKAERNGVTLAAGPEYIPAFFSIYAARMFRKGVPVHAEHFFRTLLAQMGARAELLVATRAGAVLGGMIMCAGTTIATYPFQVSAPGAEGYATTPFLTWKAMQWCVRRGITVLDMGESRAGSTVAAAKIHFGGSPTTLQYLELTHGHPQARDMRARMTGALTTRAAQFGMRFAPAPFRYRMGAWLKCHGRVV